MKERCLLRANKSEFAESAFSNVVANFCQCLSLIASKGYTPKVRQGFLIKHIQELSKTSHGFISSMRSVLVGRG